MPSQGRIVVKDFPKPSEMAPVSMLEAGPKRREDAKVAPGLGRRQSSANRVLPEEATTEEARASATHFVLTLVDVIAPLDDQTPLLLTADEVKARYELDAENAASF